MLLTVGHGTASAEDFAALLCDAGVKGIVDVRRFPGSRRHPHFHSDALRVWLPEAGVDYRWEERLGGRRRGLAGSPNVGLRNASFSAYADWMGTPAFRAALEEVLTEAAARPIAVMCSESVWWRCHRRLIADTVTLLHDREVRHLMHDGRLAAHALTDAARREGDRVVYDAGAPSLFESGEA